MYLHSNSTQILALKKLVFSLFRTQKKNFKIFLSNHYATFQCGRYSVFKKILKKNFDPEKVKKRASKVAYNRPKSAQTVFNPQSSPGHSPQPKIDFPYHEIVGPDICSLICGADGTFQLF